MNNRGWDDDGVGCLALLAFIAGALLTYWSLT